MEFKSNAKFNQDLKDGGIFHLKDNDLDISIHHVIGCGDTWYLSCKKLNITGWVLDTGDFNEAVKKSKSIIEKVIIQLLAEFAKIKDDDTIQLVRY